MGFFGSLLAIPTLLSVMGIVTNYNLEKSYFNSQINAQYYKQSREMLKAHAAQLIKEQEQKFAKAGVTWQGMVYDKDGNVNPGVKLPSSKGVVLLPPQQQPQQQEHEIPKEQVQPNASTEPTSPSSPNTDEQSSNGTGNSGDANSVNAIAGQEGATDAGTGASGGNSPVDSGVDGSKSESP